MSRVYYYAYKNYLPVKCKVRRLFRRPSAKMSSPLRRLYERSRVIRHSNMSGWTLMESLILFRGSSNSWSAENLLKTATVRINIEIKTTKIKKKQTIYTVKTPVSDHPKCEAQVVPYRRWLLTRDLPHVKHVLFL